MLCACVSGIDLIVDEQSRSLYMLRGSIDRLAEQVALSVLVIAYLRRKEKRRHSFAFFS